MTGHTFNGCTNRGRSVYHACFTAIRAQEILEPGGAVAFGAPVWYFGRVFLVPIRKRQCRSVGMGRGRPLLVIWYRRSRRYFWRNLHNPGDFNGFRDRLTRNFNGNFDNSSYFYCFRLLGTGYQGQRKQQKQPP